MDSTTIVTIHDQSSPARAEIASGFGFNCFRFIAEKKGKEVDVLWSHTDFEGGSVSPSGSGIPILFPFPGRIGQGMFQWEGREYRLPAGDGRGNAIHGFVLNRSWRVIDYQPDAATAEFHASRDDAALLDLWPADFLIRVTYSLANCTLACRIEIENPDTRPLPFGLGTHPYFRLPLTGNNRDDCFVNVPVSEQWELNELLLPTGDRNPIPNAALLQRGLPFSQMQFDHVFTGLTANDGWCRSSIIDPDSNVSVEQKFDPVFRECVVYTPGHREAVCIEPYTCVPDPFRLEDRGIDSGLRVLGSGEKFSARIEISVR